MPFSTVCEYALRALTRLAINDDDRPVPANEIAVSENIPGHFLAKILNALTHRGFVRATRGPGGGFVLARPANEILVMDVVTSIDGADSIRQRCVLGLDDCSDDQPCSLHDTCKGFKEAFIESVRTLTLQTMGETLVRKRASPRS
jgi:Rrf2 family protein